MLSSQSSPVSENNYNDVLNNYKLEVKSTQYIRKFDVSAHLNGYNYLRICLMFYTYYGNKMKPFSKILYPLVAEIFDTNDKCIERDIRNAIKLAWQTGAPEMFEKYFGYSILANKKKPSNTKFITTISDYIQLELKLQ